MSKPFFPPHQRWHSLLHVSSILHVHISSPQGCIDTQNWLIRGIPIPWFNRVILVLHSCEHILTVSSAITCRFLQRPTSSSSSVWIMACHWFMAQPLTEAVLISFRSHSEKTASQTAVFRYHVFAYIPFIVFFILIKTKNIAFLIHHKMLCLFFLIPYVLRVRVLQQKNEEKGARCSLHWHSSWLLF